MSGSDPKQPLLRSEATDSWRPASSVRAEPLDSDSSPTIRRVGSGSGRERLPLALALLPQIGDRLEEYELLETIGVGGMGAVYRALDHRLERQVALKVLPLEPTEDGNSEVVQRFLQEGRAAARLDHESIARVYALGTDRGFHFIAFEFIEGINLRQLVEERGPLTPFEAISHSLQVAGALVHATGRGVVHRDIKPSNIIITPRGQAKLVDMGLARRFERDGAHDGLTQTGMTLGSFDYISPEQARDPRDVDVRSDLYSLGCTMFHMLTGRPPFPDGTVLQKLLQHQEEPPPDLRDANPEVPRVLAAIVRKLMAKDRNRRFQSPEQLAHELLTLAAGLGYRVPGLDTSGWAPALAGRRPLSPWIWAGGAVLATAVIGLSAALIGQIWNPREKLTEGINPTLTASAAESGNTVKEPVAGTPTPSETETLETAAPRTLQVSNGIELTTALSEAPPGSTIELLGEGPFEVRRALTVRNSDLMIRSGTEARPVLRLARGTNGRRPGDAAVPVLHFVGGRIILDGIDFDLDTNGREETVTGVLAESVDLSIQRCGFRRQSHWLSAGRAVGLDVRSRAAQEPPIQIQSSSFEGNLTGIVARGPVDLRVADALFGLNPTVLRLDRLGSERSQPATIDFRFVSVLSGDGPVFRLSGLAPRVRVENSVFAPADNRPCTLIVADEPERLDWSGRDNQYARVGSFLLASGEDQAFTAVKRFAAWSDDAEKTREFGSSVTETHLWAEEQPGVLLFGGDSQRAYRLGPIEGRTLKVGARHGPTGVIPFPVAATPNGRRVGPTAPVEVPTTTASEPAGPPLLAIAEIGPPRPDELPQPTRDEPEPTPPQQPVAATDPPVEPAVGPVRHGADPPVMVEPQVVHSSKEFLDEFRRLSPRGGTIVVAAGSILTLPVSEFRSDGRWKIRAEHQPGENRPMLRFDPKANDPRERPLSTLWRTLFALRDGASLHVEGLDVVMPFEQRAPEDNKPWACFGVAPGTELDLIDCTVTLEGRTRPVRSAVVAVRPWDEEAEAGGAANAALPREATVRVTDGFFRGGDDFINVAPGRQLALTARNVVIAVGGALLRGQGLDRGQQGGPARLGLDLRQVTCWTGNGLVLIQSSPNDSALPVADIVAKDSIVAVTDPLVALCRIEGQDEVNEAIDPIRWEGQGVAYHGVEIFRQNQPGHPGGLAVKFGRPDWQNSVGLKDESPIYGDVKFLTPFRADQSPWTLTRDQVRLADDTPAPRSGVDLDRIPVPPPSN